MRKNKNKKVQHIRRHFRRVDPTLFSVLAKMDLKPLKKNRNQADHFAHLCREIVSQQLGSKAARAIHQRFLNLFPKQEVTHRRLLKFSEKELRATGMSWAKARSIRDLAHKTSDRKINLANLPHLENEAAITELTKVKGIGRWTAEMFLMFALGREDVFSFGDFGLRKGLERVYGKPRTRSQKSVEAIVMRWSPYRSYASLALWHVLDSSK